LTPIIPGSICWKKDVFIALDVKITDAQEGLTAERDRIVREAEAKARVERVRCARCGGRSRTGNDIERARLSTPRRHRTRWVNVGVGHGISAGSL
jgi:hypothetical protein